MTDGAEIERLLNQTGRTLEGLPERYSNRECTDLLDSVPATTLVDATIEICNKVLHQSDVIELLVGALQDSEPKRKYINCHHCKNGTYSCPITQMDKTLIRYANFCDECGRDLRAVVAEYWRKKDE